MEHKYSFVSFLGGNGRALLHQVGCERVDATFRELLTTGFAGVFISITGIIQFCSSLKMSENQCCCKPISFAFYSGGVSLVTTVRGKTVLCYEDLPLGLRPILLERVISRLEKTWR